MFVTSRSSIETDGSIELVFGMEISSDDDSDVPVNHRGAQGKGASGLVNQRASNSERGEGEV